MFYFSKPVGGLYMGKALVKPPFVEYVNMGAPARIFFAADLHIRRDTLETVENVIRLIRSLSPDLVLLGGDISEYDEGFAYFFERLKDVKVKMGIYAVEGNNDVDRFSGNADERKRIMENAGVVLLRDEKVTLDAPGGRMEIVGAKEDGDERTAVCGLFSDEEGVYRILLTHKPHADLIEHTGGKADLMLSGHTHGGQLNVLGFTCYELLQYERYFRFTHLSGIKTFGKTRVLVSRGIGTSKFAVRFGARPEVHLIT